MKLTRKNVPSPLRIEKDRTLRAGTLNDLLDTDLPRGSQPPVLSKVEPPSGLAENPVQRVTPWLFRRVNAPVSPTSQTTKHLEKAATDVIGSVKPPSYCESYPSKEKSTGAQQEIEITAAAKDSRADTPPQSPTQAPTRPTWPNRPKRIAEPSDHAASNSRQSGSRSIAEEERSHPGFATTPLPEPAHPPRYRPRESSLTPTLPPYCATEGSSSHSKEPWLQNRSRKPSSAFSNGGEPRLALPSHHPLLPDSAVSRIRAAYKVSNELGSAVMLQEVRMATPADYRRLDAASAPRGTRRFVSVTEREGFHRVNARLDRRSSEREARQRALSRPSDNDGRNHDGTIHRTASERVSSMKVHDISRRRALWLEEAVS
ncbi:hypothetical protein H4582DRAFT_2072975 [Lactarius indigo]|nr:hypothetical protein H4582DRAFT_2072975 [Lactarius indigo]